MAFDPEIHEVDPATGYHVFKETGHRVGIDPAPIKRVSDETEYPKWVVPHIGHLTHHRVHGYVMAPAWEHIDVARGGEVKVLVHNAEDEARALADPAPPEVAVLVHNAEDEARALADPAPPEVA